MDALLSHFGELEERDHLEADFGVSYDLFVGKVGWVTNPPLSVAVSNQVFVTLSIRASTCEDIMWP